MAEIATVPVGSSWIVMVAPFVEATRAVSETSAATMMVSFGSATASSTIVYPIVVERSPLGTVTCIGPLKSAPDAEPVRLSGMASPSEAVSRVTVRTMVAVPPSIVVVEPVIVTSYGATAPAVVGDATSAAATRVKDRSSLPNRFTRVPPTVSAT
ncbi:MAG: hypothetical protein AAFZ07_11370 [Actinomycetota bacterium]